MLPAFDRRQRLIQELQWTDLGAVISNIRASRHLPKLDYHFERHGEDLGVETKEDYLTRLRQHLERTDLEFYVRMRKQGDVMWYAVALDTREVAQYNFSKGRMWSYYFDEDFPAFVRAGSLVKLAREADEWEIEP